MGTIEHKLQTRIVPYFLLPVLLRRTLYYRADLLFTYTGVCLGALGAIGISSPLAKVLTSQGPMPTLDGGTALIIGTWFLVVAWVLFRAIYDHNKWGKSATLVRSCQRAFRRCEETLEGVLARPDPRDDLDRLYAEQIAPMVDQLIQEGALTTSLDDVRGELRALIDLRVRDLVARHGSHWVQVPQSAPTSVQQKVA